MKLFLLLFFICSSIAIDAQQTYRCEYNQSLKMKLPDSSMKQIRAQLVTQGFPESMADQFVAQMAVEGIESEFLVTMHARPDTTFIEVQSAGSDNITINRADRKTILTQGRRYIYDFSDKKWIDQPNKASGAFTKTGNEKKILNHDCMEYVDADGSYRVWIADSLPSYINPGIQVENITGAVLGYEIKSKDQFVRCEISKLDR